LLEGWGAERLELLAQPTHAGAEDEAALREHVRRRQHLGGEEGIAIRDHEDADTEPNARGRVREMAQHREWLEGVLSEAAGKLSAAGVRIHRLRRRHGHDDVIGDEQRVVPERVGLLGDLEDDIEAGQRPATGKRKPELHDVSSGKWAFLEQDGRYGITKR